MQSFWSTLPKPFTVLAPMDDVTDVVFREIVRMTAKPDVFYTEFTNVEALCSEGKESQIKRLTINKKQKPTVAQIWGVEPKHFTTTAVLIRKMGFDGIDINMGCPQRDVVKNGACSALIHNHALAKQIIGATKKGAGGLPISIKTRIGLQRIETESWIGFLLEQDINALVIHGRTAKELSKVPTHWDEIQKAVMLKNSMEKKTLIIGNGDVKNYKEAIRKHKRFGVDGVMIGRGIFENLWAFDPSDPPHEPSVEERLSLLRYHVTLFDKTWGETKRFDLLKKYFKIYVSGFPNAQGLRIKLMETKNTQEVLKVLGEESDNITPTS